IADKGWIYTDHASLYVENVQKAPQGQHMHYVKVKDGEVHTGDQVTAIVDSEFRTMIVKNHTPTHLLHQALKDVLGEHVNQAGSIVTPDRLSFDFSHYQAINGEEIRQIEQIVNEKIWEAIPVQVDTMKMDEAKEMGAMALFGEKYGDNVRVVQAGDYSIELCGGCHVSNTSEIGVFKIVSETGIGAGTRRIEAVTSKQAYSFVMQKLTILEQASTLLKTKEEKVPDRIESLYKEMKEVEKEN